MSVCHSPQSHIVTRQIDIRQLVISHNVMTISHIRHIRPEIERKAEYTLPTVSHGQASTCDRYILKVCSKVIVSPCYDKVSKYDHDRGEDDQE